MVGSGLAKALSDGDLEGEWPTLPFYARRRVLETLIIHIKLLPVGRRQFDSASVKIEWTF
jgi:hypothetical protein